VGGVDWTHLAQDKERWPVAVKMVFKFRFS
jgi:hypothetical protein